MEFKCITGRRFEVIIKLLNDENFKNKICDLSQVDNYEKYLIY